MEVSNEIREATNIKKLFNIMLVPISQMHDPTKVHPSLLLLINRRTDKSDGNSLESVTYQNFNAFQLFTSNKLFQRTIEHSLRFLRFKSFRSEEVNYESQAFKLFDELMACTSMFEFQVKCQMILQKLFNVERVNVNLINRHKKYFFRIYLDDEGVQTEKRFSDLKLGLAGFVAVSGNPELVDNVCNNGSFNQDLDDPNGSKDNPATEILSMPIYCS